MRNLESLRVICKQQSLCRHQNSVIDIWIPEHAWKGSIGKKAFFSLVGEKQQQKALRCFCGEGDDLLLADETKHIYAGENREQADEGEEQEQDERKKQRNKLVIGF